VIQISDSDVVAIHLPTGSAIGAVCALSGCSQIDVLRIYNCTIVASAGLEFGGSAIGAGSIVDDGSSVIDDVVISDSYVIVNGGSNAAVIRSGPPESEVNSLTFSGYCFVGCDRYRAVSTVSAVNASSILISGCSLIFLRDDSIDHFLSSSYI
jgi:carbonic anhydrase/acetyltransferase-like protein (isoleucine patch superfamily)